MSADPTQIDETRLSSAQLAARLGVTEGRVRQLARAGEYGARKDGRSWTFDGSAVGLSLDASIPTRMTPPPADVVTGSEERELDALRWQQQLLLAENAAQARELEAVRLKGELTLLGAELEQRDQAIAVLQAKNAELRAQLLGTLSAVDAMRVGIEASVGE